MKRVLSIIVVFMCCMMFVVPVNADMGPKPSVSIDIHGLENKTYYVTLLSKEKSTGPFSVIEDLSEVEKDIENYDIFMKFYNYKDDYYFLGEHTFSNCSLNSHYEWNYYPPEDFKILIYIKDTDQFICSDVYSRYAFNSYYSVYVNGTGMDVSKSDVSNIEIEVQKEGLSDIGKLAMRMVVTIIIEVIIAILFKIKDTKKLLMIAFVNLLTQLLLNCVLQVLIFDYILYLLEVVIIFIEGAIYHKLFNDVSSKIIIKYALISNLASFVIGQLLVNQFPHIF